MIDLNTIAVLVIFVISNCVCFWMGSRLSRGENVLPSMPGNLEIITPEEPQDRYGEIWPKDAASDGAP